MKEASVPTRNPVPVTVMVAPGSASLTFKLRWFIESDMSICARAEPGKAASANSTTMAPITAIPVTSDVGRGCFLVVSIT